jgi:hypothetical protein
MVHDLIEQAMVVLVGVGHFGFVLFAKASKPIWPAPATDPNYRTGRYTGTSPASPLSIPSFPRVISRRPDVICRSPAVIPYPAAVISRPESKISSSRRSDSSSRSSDSSSPDDDFLISAR